MSIAAFKYLSDKDLKYAKQVRNRIGFTCWLQWVCTAIMWENNPHGYYMLAQIFCCVGCIYQLYSYIDISIRVRRLGDSARTIRKQLFILEKEGEDIDYITKDWFK